MNDSERDLARFRRLADAWGGAIERWPQEDQAWARAMAEDPAAAEILTAARGLDARLEARPEISEARAAAAAGAVLGRIASEKSARGAWMGWPFSIERLFAQPTLGVSAAAACVAVATVAGALLGASASPEPDLQNLAALRYLAGEDLFLPGAFL